MLGILGVIVFCGRVLQKLIPAILSRILIIQASILIRLDRHAMMDDGKVSPSAAGMGSIIDKI